MGRCPALHVLRTDDRRIRVVRLEAPGAERGAKATERGLNSLHPVNHVRKETASWNLRNLTDTTGLHPGYLSSSIISGTFACLPASSVHGAQEMSIAVAVSKSQRIVLAADTLSTVYGYEQQPISNHRGSKIIDFGGVSIATTGRMTYHDILTMQGSPEMQLDDEARIFQFFVDIWHSLINDLQLVPSPETLDDGFVDTGIQCIVVSNHIYEVGTDLRVRRMLRFCAIGSGSEYAYGALDALYDRLDDPVEIARESINAAMTFDAKCGGEVDIVEVAHT